ncbi:dipeptidase PepE [Aliidiomarina sedimenti]|uniref:Dipeptidase PepE n=1 Tax=Aliidiomarina sedimenti TaxID=1933879 RepID=A0ABY0C2T5_9GAMM|nr:dipeptidase PepE [Aliidiomarina sedimenti]RUO31750.1 dipeptidase PepE [Aliidiomarina sedimenti]
MSKFVSPLARLLLISASKADNTPYLEHARSWLADHFADREVLFIPYAGVGMSHQAYTSKVATALRPAGINLRGIESYSDPKAALEQADAIAIGGGNTFVLLDTLYRYGLLDVIRRRVNQGVPYAGWSAGSNLAGLSIRTTNDMPIVQPPSFKALALLPVQINPHYSDFTPVGFHGETRDQRLAEFMALDGHTPVLAIQEGTALDVSNGRMRLLGSKPGYSFHAGVKRPIQPQQDCSQWL